MKNINQILERLTFAQIGWVVPNIHSAIALLGNTMKLNLPDIEQIRAEDLRMTYKGEIVPADWLTTQTYHDGTFIELVQPLSGQSMFHDYLKQSPNGGVQHLAFSLPISGFDHVTNLLRAEGYATISEVDHPIATMTFFDTSQPLGLVTEIMGIKPDGWQAIELMKENNKNNPNV